MTRTIAIVVDEADWETIHEEVAERQSRDHKAFGETMLPDGESDLMGAVLAECIRDLNEYRELWQAEHPGPGLEGV